MSIATRLEPRFGKLGREYKEIVFDKELLSKNTTAEWVTPGHPLFESVLEHILEQSREHLERGAVFLDFNTDTHYRLDVFTTKIQDGRGHLLHRRIFVVRSDPDGRLHLRQPTIFLELQPYTAYRDRAAACGTESECSD